MKSPTQQRNIIPKMYYPRDDDFEEEKLGIYIFLVIAIIIGGGGITVCIIYFNSEENIQNLEIGSIIISAVTCIITIILITSTTFKQTRNKSWRYQVKDILFHSENYFNDDNNQTVGTTLSSIDLSKTVYCTNRNSCLKSRRIPNTLSLLKRAARRDSNGLRRREISLKKTKSHDRLINYSLSNEIQTDVSGNTKDNLILKRVCIPTKQVLAQQPTTHIMIVQVPKVPGELVVLQRRKH